MKKLQVRLIFFFLLLSPLLSQCQELFIRQEPASNVPQNMIGVRLSSEEYREGKQIRTEDAIHIMYSFTPRFEVIVTPVISNHHLFRLPSELTSIDPGTPILHSHNKKLGFPRPYIFSGVDLYAKYLLIKHDGIKSHFRVAAFGEASSCLQAHDEAEPDLMGDNAGAGAGMVITHLLNKFAWGASAEYIVPLNYSENTNGNHIVLNYPNALKYTVSFGYRILPITYKNYKQINVNVYAEFEGKTFGDAEITKNGVAAALNGVPEAGIAPATFLLANSYLEFHPGLQFIINSNTRIDLSLGFNIISQSYRYTYPTHFIQLQHYFFFK